MSSFILSVYAFLCAAETFPACHAPFSRTCVWHTQNRELPFFGFGHDAIRHTAFCGGAGVCGGGGPPGLPASAMTSMSTAKSSSMEADEGRPRATQPEADQGDSHPKRHWQRHSVLFRWWCWCWCCCCWCCRCICNSFLWGNFFVQSTSAAHPHARYMMYMICIRHIVHNLYQLLLYNINI